MKSAVVLDESEFSEFVHEKIHTRASGADHFCQRFLRDKRQYAVRLIVFAVTRKQEKSPSKTLFAGIEKLVDQVFFDPDVSGEDVRDEEVREGMFGMERARHLFLFDEQY